MQETLPRVILYHYTFEKNIESILLKGLKPSIREETNRRSDAQHGNGCYLTDVPPDLLANFTRPQVSQALFSLPRKWGLTGQLQGIVWVAFNLQPDKLIRVQSLFPSQVQKSLPDYAIWLYPTDKDYLAPEFIHASGSLVFQAMASGNR
jgi:hypothetical protein